MDTSDCGHDTGIFQYSPLRTQDEIRLIRILPSTTSDELHCTLEHFDSYTDDAIKPDYVALSYCWGDADIRKPMILNEMSISITLGLWEALIAIAKHHNTPRTQAPQPLRSTDSDVVPRASDRGRPLGRRIVGNLRNRLGTTSRSKNKKPHSTPVVRSSSRSESRLNAARRRYWIDALCIDQENVQERNEQVYQMWRIYSQAEEVFAWLGPETLHTKTAISKLEESANFCELHTDPCAGCVKAHSHWLFKSHEAVERMADSTYFTRTWVIPEFLQARRLTLICGSYQIEDKTLLHCQDLLMARQAGKLLRSRYRQLVGTWSYVLQEKVTYILGHLLRLYEQSQCIEPRDKIYAMLGHPRMRILDPEMQFKPDYRESVAELLIRFAAYCDKMIYQKGEDVAHISDFTLQRMSEGLITSLSNGEEYSLIQDLKRVHWKEILSSDLQLRLREKRGEHEFSSILMCIHMQVAGAPTYEHDETPGL